MSRIFTEIGKNKTLRKGTEMGLEVGVSDIAREKTWEKLLERGKIIQIMKPRE